MSIGRRDLLSSYIHSHRSRHLNPVALTGWKDSGNRDAGAAWHQSCLRVHRIGVSGASKFIESCAPGIPEERYMKKLHYLLGFALSVALAATAQTSSQTQTPPVNPTTPANQIGRGAQTKAGTPAPSSTTAPNGQINPPDAAQPPAQSTNPNSPTTGGVAGAASSSATQVPAGDNAQAGVATMSDADLESQIQNALSKEPTLSGDNAHVKVAGDTIDLTGSVGTSKEKITATRIVQSFAGRLRPRTLRTAIIPPARQTRPIIRSLIKVSRR
jgi:hypothetical protein